MEEADILTIANKNISHLPAVLEKIILECGKLQKFPFLNENDRRSTLWNGLTNLIRDPTLSQSHVLALNCLKILSRDVTDLDTIISQEITFTIIQKANLTKEIQNENRAVALEATKCLCNLCYNCNKAREFVSQTDIVEVLNDHILKYGNMNSEDTTPLFEMKLLFILTVYIADVRKKMLMLNVTQSLCKVLADTFQNEGSCEVDEQQYLVTCDILKVLFNVLSLSKILELELFDKLVPNLRKILLHKVSNEEQTLELHNHASNLLTSVPEEYYHLLTPELQNDEINKKEYHFLGRNCEALDELLNILQHRLNHSNTPDGKQMVMPIITVLISAANSDRIIRKYLRNAILPPLREVHERPEVGERLRNKLCRLLTEVNTELRDLAAELLFVLCKNDVSRMIKYTGFGNAAGLLAQKGLMGEIPRKTDSSSGEDSDTEEYLEARPEIDPVVGCTRPNIPHPLEGMSEEQKEHEVMQLVNLMDQLISKGVVKPARIGRDGKPEAIEHVLQLTEDLEK